MRVRWKVDIRAVSNDLLRNNIERPFGRLATKAVSRHSDITYCRWPLCNANNLGNDNNVLVHLYELEMWRKRAIHRETPPQVTKYLQTVETSSDAPHQLGVRLTGGTVLRGGREQMINLIPIRFLLTYGVGSFNNEDRIRGHLRFRLGDTLSSIMLESVGVPEIAL
jgi:hypothetical protein